MEKIKESSVLSHSFSGKLKKVSSRCKINISDNGKYLREQEHAARYLASQT